LDPLLTLVRRGDSILAKGFSSIIQSDDDDDERESERER
jgi:hypothetical protein